MDSQGKEKQNDFLSNVVFPFLSNGSALLKCTTICLLLCNYLNLVLDTWISYVAGKMAPLDPPFIPAPMYHPSKVLCKDKTMKFPSHVTENRHRLKSVWWENVWTRAARQWVLLQRCLSRSPFPIIIFIFDVYKLRLTWISVHLAQNTRWAHLMLSHWISKVPSETRSLYHYGRYWRQDLGKQEWDYITWATGAWVLEKGKRQTGRSQANRQWR